MRPLLKTLFAIGTIGLLGLAGCSAVGDRSSTETPDYTVVETLSDAIEIREYGERAAASVVVEEGGDFSNRSKAFRALFNYITGANVAEDKIAMTVPVEMARASKDIAMTVPVETSGTSDGLRMRFFLPSAYTAETAPRPTNPDVSIEALPPQTVAVLTFTGFWNERIMKRRSQELERALAGSGWSSTGPAFDMIYDPPFSLPWLRRNEVAIPVERN